LNREYRRWHSPALGRDMELLIFGHAGARVLVFPTSKGRFHEWEDRDMIGALADPIRNGWFQLYCVDSVDAETWYDRGAHPGHGAWRHTLYERYLLEEVLPLSWHRNRNPFLISTGTSFGAYHALNIALRHPHLFSRVLAMSGLYDIRQITLGYSDDTVHAHDPSRYVAHLNGARLEAIRRMDIILAVGRDDPNWANNEFMSGLLWSRGIWHAFRPWDGWAHDWPWWRLMVRQYIGGHD
jgi:esterase/lipase superfamily enzyme